MKAPLLIPKESSKPWGKWLLVSLILTLCGIGAVTHKIQQEQAVGDAGVEMDLGPIDAEPTPVEAVGDGDPAGEEDVPCTLTWQPGVQLIPKKSSIEGCTQKDCSDPVLKDVTCPPYATGTVVVVTPCSADDPAVKLGGCTTVTCTVPAEMPRGYALIDPTKPATVTDCTAMNCRSATLTNVKCDDEHAFALGRRQKAIEPNRCKADRPTVSFFGCVSTFYDYKNPVQIEPPAKCFHQEEIKHAGITEWITPCTCGADSVMCNKEFNLCIIDPVTKNGMCTRLCKTDKDCGALKCDKDYYQITKSYAEFGRCASKTANQGAGMGIVDYRAENPVKPLHASISTESNTEFQLALNLDTSSTIPANTAYVYIWGKYRSKLGHAAIMYNAGSGIQYTSLWRNQERLSPRYEIHDEHKLPDVIFKLENLIWDLPKLAQAVEKIDPKNYGLRSQNCAWAVKKILHCTNFPIGRHYWALVGFPWTPWLINSKMRSVYVWNPWAVTKFKMKRFLRPDMTQEYYKNTFNTWTDPAIADIFITDP